MSSKMKRGKEERKCKITPQLQISETWKEGGREEREREREQAQPDFLIGTKKTQIY